MVASDGGEATPPSLAMSQSPKGKTPSTTKSPSARSEVSTTPGHIGGARMKGSLNSKSTTAPCFRYCYLTTFMAT
jgi:hypothetical protein